jgi:hypothetical protein
MKAVMRCLTGLAALAAAGALAVGCTSQTIDHAVATPKQKLLVSGADAKAPVTMDVYEAAFAAFSTCMSDAGLKLASVSKDGVVWRYSFPTSAGDTYQKCYAPFLAIDQEWQLENEYTSETFIKFRQCLTDLGVSPGKTVADVWDQLHANRIDPVECTTGTGR